MVASVLSHSFSLSLENLLGEHPLNGNCIACAHQGNLLMLQVRTYVHYLSTEYIYMYMYIHTLLGYKCFYLHIYSMRKNRH